MDGQQAPDPTSGVLADLQRYRTAARSIARNEALGGRRFPSLVRLVEKGREEFGQGSWMAVAIQRITYAESSPLLLRGQTPKAPARSWNGDPAGRALWMLRQQGLDRCPACHRFVPTAEALADMEDLDRSLWAEAVTRESAGEPGGDAA